MNSIEMSGGEAQPTGLAFALGFFFSFRLIVILFSVRVLGTAPRAGAELSLLVDLLMLLVVCFRTLGYAQRTFGSMVRLSSIRWVLAFLAFSNVGCLLVWAGCRCGHRGRPASLRISD
jgi:exopolysaccharide production protein ExoQ